MNITLYTNKIYAKYYVERDSNFLFVDWAIELMQHGIKSDNLHILAGLNSNSSAEIEIYFKQTLEDLKLELMNNEEELQNLYTRYLHELIQQSKLTPRDAIQKMWHLCGASGYHVRFSEFYNLNQDIESLEYGEGSVYDKTLNSSNFNDKVKIAFERFTKIQNELIKRKSTLKNST